MKSRIRYPELFQGNMKKKNYFEGWYFKHVSSDLSNVWSFIPGISLNPKDPHAFIQVINGITGHTDYITYPLEQFLWDKENLDISIGKSRFKENSVSLDIEKEGLIISGLIEYHNNIKYPSSFFSPGIMGWYSFVPFMECKHGIVSVNHTLTGGLTINSNTVSFTGGKGYIEKDWGNSFPEAWIWIQSNNFSDPATSFTFSLAKIPWLGKFFLGFIVFLYYKGEFILFSTHNKSSLTDVVQNDDSVSMTLKNKKYLLKVTAVKKTFGELKAPASGDMSRRIKESIDSEVTLKLYDLNNNILYNDTGKRAGLEVIDKIFEYLRE
jgi:tocopherol cyclase